MSTTTDQCRSTPSSLLLLADGRFPGGGHAHSAGVEAAVAVGDVHDLGSLERHLLGRLSTTGVVEAAFAAAACGLVREADHGDDVLHDLHDLHDLLDRLAGLQRELAARVVAPRSRAVGERLGRQFLRAARAAWPSELLDRVAPLGLHQSIVTGVVAGVAGGTPTDAARLACHHLAAAVTGAAVRLLGLDPMAAASLQVAVGPLVDEVVADAVADAGAWCAGAPLPGDGGALAEILAEHHGGWPARLFVG